MFEGGGKEEISTTYVINITYNPQLADYWCELHWKRLTNDCLTSRRDVHEGVSYE